MNRIRAAVYGSMVVLLGALATTTAFAQGYPAPIGNIFLMAECPAEMGGIAVVTATVQDENGRPVVGIPVTFTVSAQPGNDAFVFTAGRVNGGNSATLATDAGGVASAHVNVGSAPGTVVVRAVAGPRAAQVICAVAAAKQEAFEVVLPATGTGADAASQNGVPSVAIIGLALFAVLALSLAAAGLRSKAGRG